MLSMFSCTDINKQLEEMIPADSRGVVRIDVKSVIEKGQLADEDGNVVFPQSLKDVMSKNESAPVSEAMTLLRKIGIDTDANIYCFVPKNTFSYAALIAVNDADETKKAIEKQSGKIRAVQQNPVYDAYGNRRQFCGISRSRAGGETAAVS